MNKLQLIIVLLLTYLCTASANSKIFTPENLPKVHLQNKYRYTCDPERILSPQTTDSIDAMLYRLEEKTGIETVVAVVPSIGETDCFDFCHELLNSWGVGKKGQDNGLVILLVIDQRCIQFYTGYGLEGDLPDAVCKRIQLRYMIDYLKENRWNEAMQAGIQAIYNRLYEYDKEAVEKEEKSQFFNFLAPLLFLVPVGLFLTLRNRNRCPNCGKPKLQRICSRTIKEDRRIKVEEITYVCKNCGHVITQKETTEKDDFSHRNGGGPFIGGFGGGFGGGGGFSGGSFGGGSGGGGGAGSRF